jgi:hypothetical protein
VKALRWPALVLVPALLIAAMLAQSDRDVAQPTPPDRAVLGSQIAATDALSGLWFCAGGTGLADGFADHRVILLNSGDAPRVATITAYASRLGDGARPKPVTRTVPLAGLGRAELRLADLVTAPYVAATVEIDGGGVLVEHTISGALGADRAPCASGASSQWYVPIGATTTAAAVAPAREILVLFNPFPGDAVVDAEFTTENGFRGTPELFKGLVVPGGSVMGIDLATAGVTVSTEVATSITTRRGRVVVDRIQAYDEPTRHGLGLSSGIASAAETWLFPSGKVSTTRSERLVIYNPGDTAADVDVEVHPTSADLAVEPFEVSVRPRQYTAIDLGAEERLAPFVARGEPYSLMVQTADGTRVMAERLVTVAPGAPGAGVAVSAGSAVGAERLVADVNVADPADTESALVLLNPSSRTIAQVTLSVIAGGVRAPAKVNPAIELPPGARVSVNLAQLGTGPFTVVAEATGLIVGERELVIGTDRAVVPAVPDAATAAVPEVFSFAE